MQIEPGQLRQWTDPSYGAGVFMVTEYKGKFYPAGLQNFVLEDYWDILENGRLESGWSSSLLTELSEVVDAG